MKIDKNTASFGILAVLIAVLYIKPNILGFMYSNLLGKLVFIALIVYLTLTNTAAGLLAVIMVVLISSLTGASHLFEGMEGEKKKEDEEKKEGEEKKDGEEKKEGEEKKKSENPLEQIAKIAEAK